MWHTREVFQIENDQVYVPKGAWENCSVTFTKVCRVSSNGGEVAGIMISVNVHDVVHGIGTHGTDIKVFDIRS
jgi:hypothetical protein